MASSQKAGAVPRSEETERSQLEHSQLNDALDHPMHGIANDLRKLADSVDRLLAATAPSSPVPAESSVTQWFYGDDVMSVADAAAILLRSSDAILARVKKADDQKRPFARLTSSGWLISRELLYSHIGEQDGEAALVQVKERAEKKRSEFVSSRTKIRL
jgi:hypothetical protein